jgi:aqualysin 1
MGDGYLSIQRAFRFAATLWIAAALVACSGVPIHPDIAGPELGEPMPVHYAAANGVAGQYIVAFKDDGHVPPGLARRLVDQHGGELEFEYTAAFRGFAARLPAQALEGIRRNPHVELIEQDVVIQDEAFQQSDPVWNLDRIDQREFPLDKAYTFTHTGAGVTAYIIDTGIRFDHQEFDGRAVRGFDVFNDGWDGDDCRGHGTHVAGIVGGTVWGVAKDVNLVSVRVLDCQGSGTVSGAIAGIDWVTKNRQLPAVANMSFGAGLSESLNRAVRNLIQSGVQATIAAGNSDSDACNVSPASTREAVTVGNAGTSARDVRQPTSNWGDCVDLFAPGGSILAASHLDSRRASTVAARPWPPRTRRA